MLTDQEEFCSGLNMRAMVQSFNLNQKYIKNRQGVDRSKAKAKFLADKSIINPRLYNYHVLNWENYAHRMIYMVRNIRKVLKSQFLVVLAGEESYQFGIPANEKQWDVDNINEQMVREIMDFNSQKYTHYDNLIHLPKDVFDFKVNVHFCSFEDFIEDLKKAVAALEEFLLVEIKADTYPQMNSTFFEWYSERVGDYERNVKIFEEWEDFIYDYCINKEDWERFSELSGVDYITKYNLEGF
jgi:hypothetical protein